MEAHERVETCAIPIDVILALDGALNNGTPRIVRAAAFNVLRIAVAQIEDAISTPMERVR